MFGALGALLVFSVAMVIEGRGHDKVFDVVTMPMVAVFAFCGLVHALPRLDERKAAERKAYDVRCKCGAFVKRDGTCWRCSKP